MNFLIQTAHFYVLLAFRMFTLATIPPEESTVRDAASKSAQAVAKVLPPETFQVQYAAMLVKLATKEWFTARISSAALISGAYSKLTKAQQQDHLNHFAQLCRDDTPMVRRVAAQFLGKMLHNVVEAAGRSSLEKDGAVTTKLIPLYEELASNDQPVGQGN
jgi:serine/threonine-protein phosphatase 2A regulatory subunit A